MGGNGGGMSLHGPIIMFSDFDSIFNYFVVVVFFNVLFSFFLQEPVKRNGQVSSHLVINCTHQRRTGTKRK